MKPTKEQTKAITEFETERDVKVIAYAGAGKTSTLVKMAEADDTRGGLYLAFNKRIAEEADAKFPFNVRCSTAHSLACREMRRRYDGGKLFKNPRMIDTNIGVFGKDLKPGHCRELVARTLRYFMQSNDMEISAKHVPNLEKMGFVVSKAAAKALKDQIVSNTEHVWAKMINQRDPFPMGHDGYLKLWAMSKPAIPTDVLFVDEAQDLNPVLLGVIERQMCQVVSVGDSHQQIYEWRGAVDALDKLEGKACRLTQSFRFGATVAAEANRILRLLGETKPLKGLGADGMVEGYSRDDEDETPVDAILCRSNGGVIGRTAEALDGGREVFIPGGVSELLSWVLDAEKLQEGRPASPGELMAFTTWEEVKEFSDSVDGSHLAVFVRLVEKFGTDDLRRILNSVLKTPKPGALTISTTHKAKGLEWDSVKVDEDFMIGRKNNDDGNGKVKVTKAQCRLLYVAMTRAKTFLSIPHGIVREYQNAEII